MKTLKLVVVSFFIGMVLSVVPISAMRAACDEIIAIIGVPLGVSNMCVLTGESCGQNVCVCSYNCFVIK